MVISEAKPLVSDDVAQAAKDEILQLVRKARLAESSETAVLDALEGPVRVLPEGKSNPTTALITQSYACTARDSALPVVPAIAAMEMLMAAGDLIDDVQDDEVPVPRDRKAIGHVMETLSLLLMLCHTALGELVETGIPADRILRAYRLLDTLAVDALRGQMMDLEIEDRFGVTVEESLNVSSLKASSLISCASALGATLGTDDLDEIEVFRKFGWHIGLLSQLMNDVAAVWPGDVKSQKSDLRLKKKTLPVVYALSLPVTNVHARLVQTHYNSGDEVVSDDDLKWALWRCGAIHYTWIVAGRERARARRIAHELSRKLPEASNLEILLT